jgi:hypothetical protein
MDRTRTIAAMPLIFACLLCGSTRSAAQTAGEAAGGGDDGFFSSLRDLRSDVQQRFPGIKERAKADPSSLRPSIEDALPPAPDYTVVRRGDAYFIYGGGTASDGGGSVGRKAFQFGIEEDLSESALIGLVHENEGHPVGGVGHRDGYAAMGWYRKPLGPRADVRVGAGPYFSMNTVEIDGRQRDDKNWGLLAAIAVVYRVNDSGLGVRLQYNEVRMPGHFDTQTFMAGVSQDLGGESREGSAAGEDSKTTVGIWTGPVITNRAGQHGHLGYQAEIEKALDPSSAYSVSVIDEGNSGVNDRKGVAAQAWYKAPAGEKWSFSAGVGPYAAMETHPGDRGGKLLAIVSFKASRRIAGNTSLSCRFNRMVSGYDKDADMFMCGVEEALE